jgi:hypothetical protein
MLPTIENYSDKCIVIRDPSNMYSSEIIQLGGKYNDKLRGGAGWIFSKSMEKKVKEWVNNVNDPSIPTPMPTFKSSSTPENLSATYSSLLKNISDIESMLVEAQKVLARTKKMVIEKEKGQQVEVEQDDEDESIVVPKKRLIK